MILHTEDGKVKRFGSFRRAVAVTKSDATILDEFGALYVGGAGAVAVKNVEGDSVIFAAVPAGTVLPIVGIQVLSTGTDATSIVALRD
jgi:hypothetical protein